MLNAGYLPGRDREASGFIESRKYPEVRIRIVDRALCRGFPHS